MLIAKGWRDRVLATLMAMAGVALTVFIYADFISTLNIGHGSKLFYLGVLLVFFTGVFSFVIFGLLERQQAQLETANKELARRRDVLQGLWDATGVAANLPDLEPVLQRIVDVARPLFDAEYAALAMVDDGDTSHITQLITSGISEEVRQAIGKLPQGSGILGEVIRTRQMIRVHDLASHSAFAGFPENHPHMTNFLGLPLLYQGSVVGYLYLASNSEDFTEQDGVMAQIFSRQAAVVISNARLYQSREAYATIEERERIGRELHDGVLQTLYGLTLSLEFVLDTTADLGLELRSELNRVTETLSLMMTDIRMYIRSLGTSPVDLFVALKDMLQRQGNMSGVELAFQDKEYLTLKADAVHNLVLTVQEAVSNALRHGMAERIVVGFQSADWEYHLWVKDNGRGFNPELLGDDLSAHFGLKNMARRMEQMGGTMDITSAPGEGATIQFRWPRASL